jgi:PAS domain S-box-containing protein
MGAPSVGLFGDLESRFADVLDRVSDAIVALDRDWRFVYVNQAAEKHFGVAREQTLGKVCWDLFRETVGSVGEPYRQAAAGSTPVELEMVSPVTKRTVAQRIYPSASGLTVYFRDVSDERQTADALRESEARYRSLYEHSLDGVLLTAPTGETLAANPAACRILQRTEEELCQVGRAGVCDPTDRRLASLIERRDRSGRARGEIDMIRKDGTKVSVELSSAVFTDRHGQTRTSLSIRDLTERKRAERAMSLLADAGEELSLSLEREEIIRRLTSLAVPSIADVCIVDLLAGGSPTRAAVKQKEGLAAGAFTNLGTGRVIQTGSPELLSSVTDAAEGLATLGVRSALRVPLLVRGKPTGVLSLLITDDSRRFVVDDLRTIEALADRVALALENARLYELAVSAKHARDEMLTMVSHDLRNSLNAIGFIATELARQNGSPLATQIRSAATLADRLLADLGAMFVIESGALVLGRVMESIDSIMNEVADLFRPLAEARAVRLRAVTEKKGLTAFVDRYRMVQAVSNVVANAVEISQDGGQVDLAVKQVGDNVEVAISDTGPGIAPDEVDQIFDRHRWGNDGRRRASVGLGLVISKEYVEAHGGRIRVQNRPGSGSTFIIAIPMQPRGVPTEMPPPKRRAPSSTRSR